MKANRNTKDIQSEEPEETAWTEEKVAKLQQLTREIIAADGNDHWIRQMAYACKKKNQHLFDE